MRLGIVTALPGELACLGARAPSSAPIEIAPGVLACTSGVGPARAERAARALVARGARSLASFGVAGGLDPRLSAGAVVLATEIVDLHNARHICDADWRARLRALHAASPTLIEGPLAESDVILATPASKSARARATGALAVDMESGAVARVASAHELPFLALRAICDPATRAVPRASLVAVDVTGHMRLARLASSLLRRPSDLAGLVAMHTGWRRALRALADLAARSGVDLASPPEPRRA